MRSLPLRLLAFVHLAADIALGLARAAIDRLAPPRGVDAVVSAYRDEVMGPDGDHVWIAAIRHDVNTLAELEAARLGRMGDDALRDETTATDWRA